MLLQTLSKGSDYQKGLIHLLLEASLMVFSKSDVSLSQVMTTLYFSSFLFFSIFTYTNNQVQLQEANDLRNIAVKLVSQLAQIPSSAALVKDTLSAMPATRRLQIQVPFSFLTFII